jgi:hypothetical protein
VGKLTGTYMNPNIKNAVTRGVCMKKRQFKKDRKKGKHSFFVGRPGSLLLGFWKDELARQKAKMESGVIRNSRMKAKLQDKIDRLEYLIWDHESFHPKRREIMRLSKELVDKVKRELTIEEIYSICDQVKYHTKPKEVKYKVIERENQRVRRKNTRRGKRI